MANTKLVFHFYLNSVQLTCDMWKRCKKNDNFLESIQFEFKFIVLLTDLILLSVVKFIIFV